VAVNLSAKQLQGTQIYHTVQHALESANVPASYLDLELTESMLMDNVEDIIPVLASLKALGIRLSVDDFGTGYSSLAYLKRFPLDALKVDKSFVQDIIADPSDASITRAIITMAHSLKLKVIAEGVESEGQLSMLIGNHCDEIQGYYFSRPVPPEEVTRMLKEDHRLPMHLLQPEKRKRTLLLVDDEDGILSSMKRLLRREGYEILTASGGEEGLQVLASNPVDVILSDQRMPGMTGVEFLRRAKELYPSTVRMVLSGYTELQSVTSAINEGAISKFLTKPWDDEQLKQHLAEAFHRKELSDENERLSCEVKIANEELAQANGRLQDLLLQKQEQIQRDETALGVFQEVLQMLPWPLVGIDSLGFVVAINSEAEQLFASQSVMLGMPASNCLPESLIAVWKSETAAGVPVQIEGAEYQVLCRPMGLTSSSRGHVLILFPQGVRHA
jgi:CheY-like chemotaxis protein